MSEKERMIASTVSLVNRDLLMDILSRMRVKELCKLRCVSKQWLNLISDPYFINFHRQRSQRNPLLLFCTFVREDGWFNKSFSFSLYTMGMKGTVGIERIVNLEGFVNQSISCAGLILLLCYPHHVYVCNPSTRQFVRVLFDTTPPFHGKVTYGFGFLLSTNEYKIISLYNGGGGGGDDDDDSIEIIPCEIYTMLNNGGVPCSSRSLQVSWPSSKTGGRPNSLCLNGVIYWMIWYRNDSGLDAKIMSFDMEKEEFRAVVDPPRRCSGRLEYQDLVELKEDLCLVRRFGGASPTMEIWVLKNHVWEKEYTIDFTTFDGYHRGDTSSPVQATLLDIRNGEILLVVMRNNFYYYNIEKKSFRTTEFSAQRVGIPNNYVVPSIFFESLFSLSFLNF